MLLTKHLFIRKGFYNSQNSEKSVLISRTQKDISLAQKLSMTAEWCQTTTASLVKKIT
jgi:hypothetical protein